MDDFYNVSCKYYIMGYNDFLELVSREGSDSELDNVITKMMFLNKGLISDMINKSACLDNLENYGIGLDPMLLRDNLVKCLSNIHLQLNNYSMIHETLNSYIIISRRIQKVLSNFIDFCTEYIKFHKNNTTMVSLKNKYIKYDSVFSEDIKVLGKLMEDVTSKKTAQLYRIESALRLVINKDNYTYSNVNS